VAVRQCKTCTHWHLITTRHSMVRRIPSQVHKQAGRLLLSKFIRNEPVWYQAVLAYPPIPLPSRAPPSRSSYDTLPPEKCNQKLPKHRRYGTPQPLPIHYLEDDVRRQFFRDHPFEAFRPVTLAEAGGVADEHPIVGTAWTRLRQRGRNPSPEEYAYLFFFGPSYVYLNNTSAP
jgi:small subunit ribosomal protein S23